MSKVSRLAIALLVVAFSLPALAQMGGIQGVATDKNGKPIVGATVEFKRLDINGLYKVKTDKKGHFGHYGLPLGKFDVILLSPEGKELWTIKNVPTHPGQPMELDFNLQKIFSGQAAAQGGMSKEQAAAEKQQKESQQKLGSLKQMLQQNQQLVAQKQWAQAIQVMEQAVDASTSLKLTPKSMATLHSQLADDYAGAGQYDKAVNAYNDALAAVPNDPITEAHIYTNLGSALAKSGHADQAVPNFDKAAQLDPANAKIAFFNEGVVMYNKGEEEQAGAALDKALALDPNYAMAWYLKGMTLVGKGKVNPKTGATEYPAGTVEAFQKYLKLDPSGSQAASAQAMVKMLSTKVQTSITKH